ncbi:spore cortex biosynthesis protein YabQ [Simiaoa sp.]|uniref:spore cortex biosynthesis protein YabQ n=1 Tax=Simiaoa sp. TaxID=2944202 RepID=UPI003F7CFCD4
MNENVFLLHAVLLGVEITFLYDILRILRRVFVHSGIMVSLEDIAFWIYCAGEVFLLMFRESNGNLRWFAVLGALAGMYLYHRTFSPLLVKYVSGLLNSILSPIRRKTQAVKSWLKKQLTSLWKMLKIFYKRRCAHGKEKNSLPQETAPEPVQHVLSESGRIDDHGRRGSAECGITTED